MLHRRQEAVNLLLRSLLCLGSVFSAKSCSPTTTQVPFLKISYTILYNTSASKVSKDCGTYVGETFLQIFLPAVNTGTQAVTCKEDYNAVIEAHSTAFMTVYNNLVEINTSINIYVPSSATSVSQDQILGCFVLLNTSLQDLDVNYAHLVDSFRHIAANPALNCSAASLSPEEIIYASRTWFCPSNYTFSAQRWQCTSDNEICTPSYSPPSITPTTTPTIRISQLTKPTARGTPRPSTPHHTTPHPVTVPPTDFIDERAWGIDVVGGVSQLQLIEGRESRPLPVTVWANRSLVCKDHSLSCHVSLDISVESDTNTGPTCRRTGEAIPQVVVGRPSWGSQNSNYCSLEVEGHHYNRMDTNLKLKAVSDSKYDGTQRRFLVLSLTRTTVDSQGRERLYRKSLHRLPVVVEDKDRKATCQSINDPHISTFEDLEYNNYYEGEFVLYRHTTLPFKVHAVYQKCSPDTPASCNCAIAVQSGDDVIVIDRCLRERQPIRRLEGEARDFTRLRVQLYLNGELTPGTSVYQEAGGKKYYIYLPHGTVVKALVSSQLVNVWITASPSDASQTEGLCGRYNSYKLDIRFPNGTLCTDPGLMEGNRSQPREFIASWRVDMDSDDSLMRGVPRQNNLYSPDTYCRCDVTSPSCSRAGDVSLCDGIHGDNITEELLSAALSHSPRTRRDVASNTVTYDPIVVDRNFVPPKYKWKDEWNDVIAEDYCRRYIRDNYTIGRLCSQIAAVNFKREISTCMEDILITGNTSWADSARDAMKEQCLEEVQRNASLPEDMAHQITGAICINDCSNHGQCVNGTCRCAVGYSSPDCSVDVNQPPYVSELPQYGLCDVRTRDCNKVVVYGENFLYSPNLECHLQEVKVGYESYVKLPNIIVVKGRYMDFNAVECSLPELHSYLVSISNNGTDLSDPLLFLPYDSVCRKCDMLNISCEKQKNSCIIDARCYMEGESSASDHCLVCTAYQDEYQWTTRKDGGCARWSERFLLPDWAVALLAAVGGSLIGVLAGFLLYKCCCKSKSSQPSTSDVDTASDMNTSPFEEAILHRNRGLPTFSSDRFTDIHLPQPRYQHTYCYDDGQGVENGVDSTTYF